MPDRRVALLVLGIPAILVYGTLAIAQMRSARAMSEFTHLQKDYPPDSMKKPAAEIQRRKMNLLALAERMAPDNAETAFQTSLLQLVRAETESLQPEGSSSQEGETNPKIQASLREGLRWIDRAILLNPGYAEYSFVKATILQNVGNAAEKSTDGGLEKTVADLLRRADFLDPYKPSLHFRIGSFWLALEERERAKQAFTVALTDSHQYAQPILNLLWSSSEDPTEMGAFLGEEPLSRALFAEFLWNHGYKEQSEKEFSEAAKGRPINYRVGELLVQHFFRTGRPPAARQILGVLDKQSSEWSPTEKARIRYFEGQSYFLEKRYQEAIASYEVALSIDPGMFYVHEALGKVFAETGDYDRAIARLRFLLAKSGSALPPQEAAELRVELGQAYEKKNLFVQALSEYFQASKLDPANEMAQKRAAELGKEHL